MSTYLSKNESNQDPLFHKLSSKDLPRLYRSLLKPMIECDKSAQNNSLSASFRSELYILFIIKTLLLIRSIKRSSTEVSRSFFKARLLQNLYERLTLLSFIYSRLCALTSNHDHDIKNYDSCTIRDLYYHLSRHFCSQSKLIDALHGLCTNVLCVQRHELSLHAGSRGFIGGSLKWEWQNSKQQLLLTQLGIQGLSIPGFIALRSIPSQPALVLKELNLDSYAAVYAPGLKFLSSRTVLLVIEKDAIFQRLMQEAIFNNIPSILVTSKGFPCLAVRSLLRYIIDEWNRQGSCLNYPPLRVFGIADYNPAGVYILLQYRWGSRAPKNSFSNSIEGGAYYYSLPELRWLAIHRSDLRKSSMNVLPLTARDRRLLSSILRLPTLEGLQDNHSIPQKWRDEVCLMLSGEQRAELESFSDITTPLSSLLTSKILCGKYF